MKAVIVVILHTTLLTGCVAGISDEARSSAQRDSVKIGAGAENYDQIVDSTMAEVQNFFRDKSLAGTNPTTRDEVLQPQLNTFTDQLVQALQPWNQAGCDSEPKKSMCQFLETTWQATSQAGPRNPAHADYASKFAAVTMLEATMERLACEDTGDSLMLQYEDRPDITGPD